MFNRSAVKNQTKQMLRAGNPAPWLVTLVFLLATTWVSQIVDLVVPNPFDDVLTNMQQMLINVSGSAVISDSTINAMTQQVFSALSGGTAMWAILAALIVAFYSMVVGVGYTAFNLHRMRGEESGYGDLFSYFYLAGKIILLEVLKVIFVYLWSLLFIFPGIVASYRYRMAEYALIDEPDISALEAIRRSKRMMLGHKWELFTVDVSFIGWQILCTAVVSIISQLGFVAVMPDVVTTILALIANTACSMFLTAYISLTEAGFYLYLLGHQAPPVHSTDGTTGQSPYNGGNDDWDHPQNPFGGNDQSWNQ